MIKTANDVLLTKILQFYLNYYKVFTNTR